VQGQYFSNQSIVSIQQIFINFMAQAGLNLDTSPVGAIKSLMFKMFKSDDFLSSYMLIATQAARIVGIPPTELVLQATPTPRVFRPGTHGTSFHCDYWYGHGVDSSTIWLPLTAIAADNSFYVCSEKSQGQYYEELKQARNFSGMEDALLSSSSPVLPESGFAFLFGSKVLHGSPLNSSTKTRISIDFRIAAKSDPTSTKDLENYFHFNGQTFTLPTHPLSRRRLLKYVCGGPGKNTFSQHALIESAAERYNLDIAEQEAEIERFGYPMFAAYMNGQMDHKKIEGIVIASHTILDQSAIAGSVNSNLQVWCALENMFLKQLHS